VSNEATQYYAEGSTEDFDDRQFNELWVTSYICFIDSLIDHPGRCEGDAVTRHTPQYSRKRSTSAELFNEIANYSVCLINLYTDIQVERGVESHCRNKLKRWILRYKGPIYGVIFKYSFLFAIIISAIMADVAVLPTQPIHGVCRLPDTNVTQYP
jgi:hypothetical protein